MKPRATMPEPADQPASAVPAERLAAPAAEAPAAEAPTAETSDEPLAPPDAVPIQTAPAGAAANVEVVFESGAAVDRLLPAIESVTEYLRGRPGPLAVVLQVSVAGATRQIRLPDRVAWDDRLAEGIRRAAELPVEISLRAPHGEP